jgi:hypothetical protein
LRIAELRPFAADETARSRWSGIPIWTHSQWRLVPRLPARRQAERGSRRDDSIDEVTDWIVGKVRKGYRAKEWHL